MRKQSRLAWSKFIGKAAHLAWADALGRAITVLRALRRRNAAERALVLGDSHAWVFYYWQFDLKFPRLVFDICQVPGATASGLENPNSKTQAGPKFEQAIRKHPAQVYILLLGEVDTGFVIWYRAQKYQASVDEMLSLAVDRYGNFIRKLRSLGKVIVVSAPLPTIPDENQCGEVANLRKEIRATQRERIQLTLEFNRRVAQACAVEDASFVDLDPFSLDERGLVKRELLNADPCDHHYNPLAYARLLVEKLQPLLATDDL